MRARVGAFQRAHRAVIAEAASRPQDGPRWGSVGAWLRQSDTRDAQWFVQATTPHVHAGLWKHAHLLQNFERDQVRAQQMLCCWNFAAPDPCQQAIEYLLAKLASLDRFRCHRRVLLQQGSDEALDAVGDRGRLEHGAPRSGRVCRRSLASTIPPPPPQRHTMTSDDQERLWPAASVVPGRTAGQGGGGARARARATRLAQHGATPSMLP